jgi:hypothetical protein
MTKAVAIASNMPTPITITISKTLPGIISNVRLATKFIDLAFYLVAR